MWPCISNTLGLVVLPNLEQRCLSLALLSPYKFEELRKIHDDRLETGSAVAMCCSYDELSVVVCYNTGVGVCLGQYCLRTGAQTNAVHDLLLDRANFYPHLSLSCNAQQIVLFCVVCSVTVFDVDRATTYEIRECVVTSLATLSPDLFVGYSGFDLTTRIFKAGNGELEVLNTVKMPWQWQSPLFYRLVGSAARERTIMLSAVYENLNSVALLCDDGTYYLQRWQRPQKFGVTAHVLTASGDILQFEQKTHGLGLTFLFGRSLRKSWMRMCVCAAQ